MTAILVVALAAAWLVVKPAAEAPTVHAEAMPKAVPVLAAPAQAKDVQILLRGLGAR